MFLWYDLALFSICWLISRRGMLQLVSANAHFDLCEANAQTSTCLKWVWEITRVKDTQNTTQILRRNVSKPFGFCQVPTPRRNFTLPRIRANSASFLLLSASKSLDHQMEEQCDAWEGRSTSANNSTNIYSAMHKMRETSYSFYTPLSVMEVAMQFKMLYKAADFYTPFLL